MIYLDNAATTLHKPKEVQEAVIAAFGQMGNSGRGASEPALKALGTVYDAREALARLFHAENASEIVFTANSTEALNIAIKGILDPGDHVITTVLEHNSVLRPLYECRRKGAEMTILTCDEYANISYEEMEKMYGHHKNCEWETFRLKVYEGYTFGEISASQGVELSTVKSRYYSMLKRVRKEWDYLE